jgi:hypothetical protein
MNNLTKSVKSIVEVVYFMLGADFTGLLRRKNQADSGFPVSSTIIFGCQPP